LLATIFGRSVGILAHFLDRKEEFFERRPLLPLLSPFTMLLFVCSGFFVDHHF